VKAKWFYLILTFFLGSAIGLGIFTFQYAEGFSYLSSDPKVCANCHIMNLEYDSWQKSGHHHTATCTDCHLPNTFPYKYISKAENGYHHSKGFTFQDFNEPIMIKKKNSKILQENCLRCHKDLFEFPNPMGKSSGKELNCVHCHLSVGHGPKTGLGGPYSKKEKETAYD
jgi:cytochrome c nitrite reductase small subunit